MGEKNPATEPRKPRILIGCDVDEGQRPACRLNLEYADGIIAVGGVPLILPPLEADLAAVLEWADGVLFTGGNDYDPAVYGQPIHKTAVLLHPRRGRSDLLLARHVLAGSLPVLGICGGLQLLNIALGGDLVQDIPDQVPGALPHRAPQGVPSIRHQVRIQPGSLLESVVKGRDASVNSYHHQAVGRAGRGLRISASAPDGVVEGIEGEAAGRFLLAVQWHPERDPDADSWALFGAFIEAAREGAGRRGR